MPAESLLCTLPEELLAGWLSGNLSAVALLVFDCPRAELICAPPLLRFRLPVPLLLGCTGVVGADREERVASGLKRRGEWALTGVALAECDTGVPWPLKLVALPPDWLDFGMLMVRVGLLAVELDADVAAPRSGKGLLVVTRLRNWSEMVTRTRNLILMSFSL